MFIGGGTPSLLTRSSLQRLFDGLQEIQPFSRAYGLDAGERLVREFVLQLELGRLQRDYFLNKFGVDVLERFRQPLAQIAETGWIVWDDEEIKLTEQGLARADQLIPSFYQPRHRDVRYS